MTDWLKKGNAIAGVYRMGQTAALEGRTKKDCPYKATDGWSGYKFAAAWIAGFDAVIEARKEGVKA